MANVKTVQDRSNGALLILDDGVKVWTPDKELARTLLGKPIPPDWTRRDNENGPMALPPKPRGAGGMTAWRNTKEGFEAEAAGRRRWQEIEEERKDRRTALMTAAERFPDTWPIAALEMYEWLRESSPAAGPAVTPASAGVATTEARPRTPPQAGAPTSVVGEDAGEGPGEQTNSPGSTIYSMRPEDCTHRAASGRWLPTKQVEGVPICPRCGMSAVLYRESA